ncbi:sporulation membrane protein YtaF [Paraclostridium bifermentans]|uniref:sporulation membrane protein YtaF n=1 Tax=Paraclostridium bifermentans TaxID=1490 RepID=UPI002906403F|nr:sporulation membrane protein YtaF [Paraclostridium bifermentans]MDU3337870.1 sporulation membrane protein YtaF [Paraclostridium bifermentans]
MIESLILVSSLCIDTFVASIAYGTDRIKIPFYSNLVINLVCSLFLGISLALGGFLKDFLSPNTASVLSFALLLSLGFFRLFESFFKTYVRKFSSTGAPLTFKVFDFKFVLEIYANETKADYDKSKTLTLKEAVYLAVALSLDSLAVGFGSSLVSINHLQVIILSFVIGTCCLFIGVHIGKKFIEKVDLNLSWLSGLMLIVLAFIRFI